MKQSSLFLKTQKEFPKDEIAKNAQLLIKANFVHKLMSGVYSFLPLGFRVREKIMNIIREEMNALGSSELVMPALHPKAVWETTGRWDVMNKIMYQFKDHSGREVGLGPTHEEIIAVLAKDIINSYADLPLSVYQIQTKFRDEPRAKSGVLRGREFTMKDLYSFHENEESLKEFYEQSKMAYTNVFRRCGLTAYCTEASGGDFSKEYSHEYMVETSAGEDETLLCRECLYAQNSEITNLKEGDQCPKCAIGKIEKVKTIEVGNIFKLGTKFSIPNKLLFRTKEGDLEPVIMGSYGIGIERLLGTIVETHHDERGIIWPKSVAPFLIHLLKIGSQTKEFAEEIYAYLTEKGIEVLYDDREGVQPGEKFFDADLIGIPWRIVISDKTLQEGKVEIKSRIEKEARLITKEEIIQLVL